MDRSSRDAWPEPGTMQSFARTDGRPKPQSVPAPSAASLAASLPERMEQLAHAIEHEVIPRLMVAHRAHPDRAGFEPHAPVGEQGVAAFAKLILMPDDSAAWSCIQAMRTRCVPIESIYLDLLAPTARYLGELWMQDLCDFSDVTVGLGRLQRVLRELSHAFGQDAEPTAADRRVLLLPSPGEQHTFGLIMVGEFFRRAGWDVAGGAWQIGDDAIAMVEAERFDIVGFSLGGECHLDALARCIEAVRRSSRNRAVGIMVGGPLFLGHPEYLQRAGADLLATDGRSAPDMAEQLVARHERGS